VNTQLKKSAVFQQQGTMGASLGTSLVLDTLPGFDDVKVFQQQGTMGASLGTSLVLDVLPSFENTRILLQTF
jgi:hypothetical protein